MWRDPLNKKIHFRAPYAMGEYTTSTLEDKKMVYNIIQHLVKKLAK